MISDLIEFGHISDRISVQGLDDSSALQMRKTIQKAKDCVESRNVKSVDCRIAISKVITQQVKIMLPKLVENYDNCQMTRNYPSDYEVDLMFPPVGCAKDSTNILIAHKLFWSQYDKKTGRPQQF